MMSAAPHLNGDAAPVPGAERFQARTCRVVHLGPLRVAFRSNESPFRELRYFSDTAQASSDEVVHYTVNCCNLDVDTPWPIKDLESARDVNYRGKRFAAGYYLTDHFGPPAYLITRGTQLWIFAYHFKAIVWPFVVKYLLTLYSIDQQLLHLKAAAIATTDQATLLIGRGGTGKTVALTQLCATGGARFLANTHLLIRDLTVMPVASAMRVRNDPLFGPVIARGDLPAAVKEGEFLADPFSELGWNIASECPVQNICLLDYRGPQRRLLQNLDRTVLLNYMESFSLAANIYGLREDVLDHLGGDVMRFSVVSSLMKAQLKNLVERCRCYYVSCDLIEAGNLRALQNLLA